jgi:beta-N-acetylhexosaminidase
VDLLLVAYDGRQFYRIFDCALAASARGAVDRTVMAKAIARLDARARPATQAAASAPR